MKAVNFRAKQSTNSKYISLWNVEVTDEFLEVTDKFIRGTAFIAGHNLIKKTDTLQWGVIDFSKTEHKRMHGQQ